MKLSEHFTLEEFTISQTAARAGIDNTPSEEAIENMKKLCSKILEPLRSELQRQIIITSGYRCTDLNTRLGGSPTSQHMSGQAADIIVPGIKTEELFHMISDLELPYDQLIEEFYRWVHVSYNEKPRNEKLYARLENGITKYFRFNID